VRGIGFDRLDFFFLSTDLTQGPDIANLPLMNTLAPMPGIVTLSSLPPPEAPAAGHNATEPAPQRGHGLRGLGYAYPDPRPEQ
jgi:hypothetical protein